MKCCVRKTLLVIALAVVLLPAVPGAASALVVTVFSEVVDDPVNGLVNPKAIPGANVIYTVTAANQDVTPIDKDTVSLVTPVPSGTILFVDKLARSGPVAFIDGTPSSGLVFRQKKLGHKTSDLEFSGNGGTTFDYIPTPDALGYDPNVTHIRVTPGGIFRALSVAGAPNFSIKFQVLVQ